MATTQLSDIYDPVVFDNAVQEKAVELNKLVQAGVMVNDPVIARRATEGSSIGELPFFHGLTNDEPDYSNDDPAQEAVPAKITSGVQTYATAYMHKAWSTMDLAREIGSQDPLGAIIDRVSQYWATVTQSRLIQSVVGVIKDNVANDGSDMVIDISEATNAVTDANLISGPAVIDAASTMGDHSQELAIIAMHSVVYSRLQKQNLIQFIPNSEGIIQFPTYLGYRVLVDDALPVETGLANGANRYYTLLLKEGVFAYGKGKPTVPSEIERKPSSGNGGGQDILHSRATEIIHPYGFAFDKTGIAGQTASYAELADGARWNRVYSERKNIGLAALITNG